MPAMAARSFCQTSDDDGPARLDLLPEIVRQSEHRPCDPAFNGRELTDDVTPAEGGKDAPGAGA